MVICTICETEFPSTQRISFDYWKIYFDHNGSTVSQQYCPHCQRVVEVRLKDVR